MESLYKNGDTLFTVVGGEPCTTCGHVAEARVAEFVVSQVTFAAWGQVRYSGWDRSTDRSFFISAEESRCFTTAEGAMATGGAK